MDGSSPVADKRRGTVHLTRGRLLNRQLIGIGLAFQLSGHRRYRAV